MISLTDLLAIDFGIHSAQVDASNEALLAQGIKPRWRDRHYVLWFFLSLPLYAVVLTALLVAEYCSFVFLGPWLDHTLFFRSGLGYIVGVVLIPALFIFWRYTATERRYRAPVYALYPTASHVRVRPAIDHRRLLKLGLWLGLLVVVVYLLLLVALSLAS